MKDTKQPPQYVFEVELKPYPGHPRPVTAATAGRAKYLAYLDIADLFNGFGHFLQNVASVRKVGSVVRRDVHAVKDFDRVCAARGVPFARVGMSVSVAGRQGTIVEANESANFNVLFEDGTIGNCHPCWDITYFNILGEVIAQFGRNG